MSQVWRATRQESQSHEDPLFRQDIVDRYSPPILDLRQVYWLHLKPGTPARSMADADRSTLPRIPDRRDDDLVASTTGYDEVAANQIPFKHAPFDLWLRHAGSTNAFRDFGRKLRITVGGNRDLGSHSPRAIL